MNLKIRYILVALFLLCMFVSPAYAEQAQQSQIESVLVDVNGTIVEIDMMDYAMAIASGSSSPLFNYLKGSGDAQLIVGIKGGGKYIDIMTYALQFAIGGSDTFTALDNCPALPNQLVNSIKRFNGFDDQGNPVLLPVLSIVTGQDLNIIIETLVPNVFNLTVAYADAQTKLNATIDSILVLTVEGRDAIEFLYISDLLDGTGGFLAPAVQGYTQAEIRGAIASVREPVRAEELNVVIVPIVPGVVNVTIPFAEAQDKLGAEIDSTLVLTVQGKPALELDYNATVLDGLGGFIVPAVQDYNIAEVKAGVVTLKK